MGSDGAGWPAGDGCETPGAAAGGFEFGAVTGGGAPSNWRPLVWADVSLIATANPRASTLLNNHVFMIPAFLQ
jgi:hypothetical protein